ncbi:MAG TPA: carbon-nitrogen hydrolase family protein [Chitinophagaceae bacterium]|nr:carbon-nitrogen hydrolase family protein [Chitinophagaceae bacterium]
MKKITACLAQLSPVFLKKEETTEKAIAAILEAGQNGARLIVFPEAFIPGYPEWVWTNPPGKKNLTNPLYEALLENAVSENDLAIQKISAAAKKAKLFVVIGLSEKNSEASNASLYNSIFYIDDQGNLLGRHRKLVPTAGERLAWTPGDGSTLETYNTEIGRLGGLICWENYMPLARYAMYAQGVQIYVAPTWDYGPVWHSTLKHIAKEGAVFVIGVGMPFKVENIPEEFEFKKLYETGKEWINPGDSVMINPKGEVIAGPLNKAEGLIYAELDLSLISHSKLMLDVAGHYARPDVFNFSINRTPHRIMDEKSK